MGDKRFIWAGLVVVVGALQGWDSGVLQSTRAVQWLVAIAIAAPAATLILTEAMGARAAAVAAAFVLLTIARMIAPSSLPTLHLIAFVPALIILYGMATRGTPTSAPSSTSAEGSTRPASMRL